MANYNVTITDEGAALLATVIATQGAITFTEARLSDTNYDGAAQTLTENTFAGTFLTTTVSASKNSATELKASAIFHSSSVTEPHDMYSLGIIGTDGNTTALVCVLTTTNPDNVEPTDSLSSTYTFNAFIGVSSTDNITVTGTAAGIVYDTDSIDVLADVDAPNPSNSDLLIYNGSTSKWTAQANPFSNENLFLNPFFTVNQRGFTSGITSTNGKYNVDMWLGNHGSGAGAGVLSKTSNGMHFAPSGGSIRLYQMPTDPTIFDGKTLTFSILCAEGNSTNFEYLSGTLTNFDSSSNSDFYRSGGYIQSLSYIAGYSAFMIFVATECTIAAAKLELGSVSTLANDVEPNYTSELLKCQRSFIRFGARSSSSFLAVLTATSSTTALGVLPLPVDMSGTMTLTYAGTFTLVDSGSDIAVTGIAIRNACYNLQGLQVTVSGGLTAGHAVLMYADSGAYIDISTQ